MRLRRALCGPCKPALEVTFLASHISLQSPLSLEMRYLMFNTSSYSTTLIFSVICSHFDQPSVDGFFGIILYAFILEIQAPFASFPQSLHRTVNTANMNMDSFESSLPIILSAATYSRLNGARAQKSGVFDSPDYSRFSTNSLRYLVSVDFR